MYDFFCACCGEAFESLVPYDQRDLVRCRCGAPTERQWRGRTATVIPDSIPGGMVLENLTPQPKRYYSRSEIKLAQEIAGAVPHVRHVGEPGSDKSKHTSKWI